MTIHQWHILQCVDCEKVIAYSFEPIQLQIDIELRCYLCAHVHAQVATWLMPICNSLSTNSLYGVSKADKADILRMQFERVWSKLYAKLEEHRVAKASNKLHANKIPLDKM